MVAKITETIGQYIKGCQRFNYDRHWRVHSVETTPIRGKTFSDIRPPIGSKKVVGYAFVVLYLSEAQQKAQKRSGYPPFAPAGQRWMVNFYGITAVAYHGGVIDCKIPKGFKYRYYANTLEEAKEIVRTLKLKVS